MSRNDPTSNPGQEMEQAPRHREQPIEPERGNEERPLLKWLAVEDPDQSFLLDEDDHVLDSYFNPQYDIWEVLIRLEPDTETE